MLQLRPFRVLTGRVLTGSRGCPAQADGSGGHGTGRRDPGYYHPVSSLDPHTAHTLAPRRPVNRESPEHKG